MQYCMAMKRVWLLLGIFSAVSIAVGAPLMAVCALRLEYVPLAILTLFVCHGIWGAPFYFRALWREKMTIRLLPLVLPTVRQGGQLSYAEIGAAVGLTADGARFLVLRAIRRGYIRILRKNADASVNKVE
ncbi:MAG: hypothetical protein IKL79_00855 [Clostridia bacterium]|nr:hypothetical protein [Clostridia bacterium]